MSVVSDTSPLLNLTSIGKLDLLGQLYREVIIPPAVIVELRRNGYGQIANDWLVIRAPDNLALVAQLRGHLDPGESEAIAVALEMHADRLLIDERRGRKIAAQAGLSIVGLLGVLAEAKKHGLISACKPMLDEMIRVAGFWIGEELYDRFLNVVGEKGASGR